MKPFLFSLVTAASINALSAVDLPAKAIITNPAGASKQVFLTSTDKKTITYLDTPQDKSPDQFERKDVKSIFFFRPSSFQKGFDAIQNGKFDLAVTHFAKCKDEYKKLNSLKGNYSVISAFYEMESTRRSGNLEGFGQLLDEFRPETLTNENHIQQLEIYPFWNALQAKSWKKIDQLAKQWTTKKLSGSHKAQISYCHGLAYDGLGQKEEALFKLNEVIVFSQLKERELVINAAQKIIDIILSEPSVEEALKTVGTRKENKTTREYRKLIEAASVAKLWDNLSAVQGRSLPSKYKKLLKVEK